MTVAAAQAGSPRGPATSRRAGAALLASLSLLIPTQARAQVGALVSIYSDDRFRGVSVSDGRPVGILDVSYDARNGLYAALSGRVAATRADGLQPSGFTVNGGYATRVSSRLTADVGVVHSRFSHYSGLSGRRYYTEAYAGLAGKLIGARIAISPDYLGTARWTAYGEVDAHVDLSRHTLVDFQVGVLTPIGGKYGSDNRPQLDARVGLAQRLGPVTLHTALSTRSKTYFYRSGSGRSTALIIGLSTAL